MLFFPVSPAVIIWLDDRRCRILTRIGAGLFTFPVEFFLPPVCEAWAESSDAVLFPVSPAFKLDIIFSVLDVIKYQSVSAISCKARGFLVFGVLFFRRELRPFRFLCIIERSFSVSCFVAVSQSGKTFSNCTTMKWVVLRFCYEINFFRSSLIAFT